MNTDTVSKNDVVEEEVEEIEEKEESFLKTLFGLFKKYNVGIGNDISNIPAPSSLLLPFSTTKFYYKSFIKHFNLLLKANNTECKYERMLLVFKYVLTSIPLLESTTKSPIKGVVGETRNGNFQVTNYENENQLIEDNFFYVEQITETPSFATSCIYNKSEGVKVNFHHTLNGYFHPSYIVNTYNGKYTIHLGKYNETYSIILPDLFVRLLRGMFDERCGKLTVTKSDSNLQIIGEFHAKPFLGGSLNQYDAKLFDTDEVIGKNTKSLYNIKGTWKGDAKITDCMTKETKPFYNIERQPATETDKSPLLETDSSIVWKPLIGAKNLATLRSRVVEKQLKLNWIPTLFTKNEITGVYELKEFI